MKETLEKKFQDGRITEEETKKYQKQILIKKILFEVLYIFMIIFSLVKVKRISVFFYALGGGKVNFYTSAVVMFFVTLALVLIDNTLELIYVLINYKKEKKDWLSLINKVEIKGDIYIFLCKCIAILLFIMIYVTTPCTVVGQSMEPTFQSGDRVFTSELFYTPKKDDVVVFDAEPYVKYSKSESGDTFYIKRVCAVKGDTLSCNDGKVYINQEYTKDILVMDFELIRKKALISDDVMSFEIPKGYVLVMGDNRDHSNDSRSLGLIKESDIFGKVFIRLFPISKLKFY